MVYALTQYLWPPFGAKKLTDGHIWHALQDCHQDDENCATYHAHWDRSARPLDTVSNHPYQDIVCSFFAWFSCDWEDSNYRYLVGNQ
jgi:hypothetical protein